MKKFLLSLVAMLVTMGVWADNVQATLNHTAGTRYGSAATEANTVDAAQEYVNNDATTGWAGWAFAEFSFTLPEGHSVSKATFTYASKTSRGTRTNSVYYLNDGVKLDFETVLTDQVVYNFAGQKTKLADYSDVTTSYKTRTIDVTDAVKAAASGVITFQVTNDAASGFMAGKGDATNMPTLVIETVEASSQAKVTVNWVCGTTILKSEERSENIGSNLTLKAEDKQNFFKDNQKYIYSSDDAETVVVASDGSAIVTITMREAATFNCTLLSSLGGTIGTASGFEGENVGIAYPQYVNVDGTLYSAAASNKEYNKYFSLTEDNMSQTVNYSASDITNVVYFSEAEDIEGTTKITTGNANVRCSMAAGAIAEKDVVVVNLPAGKYKAGIQVWGNTGNTLSVKAGDATIVECATAGYITGAVGDEFTLTEATDVVIPTQGVAGNAPRCFDWLYIVKTGEYVAPLPEIVLDVVVPDVSASEVWNIYENEDYKVYFDITKNLPLDPTRTYTLEDMDASYSYIYNKNDIVTNDYGTKNWQKYEYTSASVKIGANNELEAIVEAKNGEDVIKGKFVFNNPNPITVTLNGETEYVVDAYAVSAKNKGSEAKADYSVQFGVKAEAYESKTTFTEDDLMANGNSIRVATVETKIVSANITLTVGAESQTFEGTVVGADEKTYAIEITTNIPSKEAKKETVDFGAILGVSEDEGDIKFVAENDDAKFVGYITVDPVTTDVPSGEYDLLSYTKYGANSDFGYMLDAVEDGKVTVTNNEGEISIVATFKQNNVEYTVTASAAPAPELETVTITEGEGAYTVTSTSETAALYYLCKPMSWLDEGETPESVLNDEITGMGSMVDSEETWEMYEHMGLEPAPKTFTIADYQELYAGEEMFIIAANVGWDGEKLAVISNIATQTFTVPVPAPVVTITEDKGVYTVTSTSETAALYYLCKPMSWLDEGETPESVLNDEITGMGSMVDSEETWEMYEHMGLEPAPKTFTIADYQELYAGEEMFIIAANVGWDGEKLAVISNIATQTFTVPVPHTWDFTNWSEETIANLKADAATNEKTEGEVTFSEGTNWTYVEKAPTDKNGAVAYEKRNAQKDKCYWQLVIEENPTANGETIKEFEGLEFACTKGGKENPRSLAIAVDYPSTSLGTYHGAQYLWLGGSGIEYFTIKNVKVGSTIKMGVESHKLSEGRGVTLSNVAENPAAPTVFEEQEWTVTGDGELVDVTVTNTNGCHIYYIDAEINDVPSGIQNISVNENVVGKFVENGKVVIVKNGKKFSVSGAQMK